MIERPLVGSALFGLLFGDLSTALAVGIFFELFWLDQLPLGAHIPPNGLGGALIALTLCGLSSPLAQGGEVPPIMIGVVAALGLGLVEARTRRLNDAGHNALLRWARGAGLAAMPDSPERIVKRHLLYAFGVNLGVFTLIALLSAGALWLLAAALQEPVTAPVSRPALWMIAASGAAASLRLNRAFAALLVFLAMFALVGLRF